MKRLISLVLIVVLTGSVFAEWDQIDFGKGDINVESGFTNWNCQGDVDGSSRTRSTSWDSSFTYVINGDKDAPSGAAPAGAGTPWLEGRDLGDDEASNPYRSPYTDLNADCVMSSYEMWLTIQDLDAGDYTIMTWHNSFKHADTGAFELRVTDSTRSDACVYDNVKYAFASGGLYDEARALAPLYTHFTANGTDDVIIHIVEDAATSPEVGAAILNGIALTTGTITESLRVDLQMAPGGEQGLVTQEGFQYWSPENGSMRLSHQSWDPNFVCKLEGAKSDFTPQLNYREWDDSVASVAYIDDMNDLSNDCVTSGAWLWLNLDNLDSGLYELRTYHNAYVQYDPGLIDIEVSIDDGTTYTLVYDDYQMGHTGNSGTLEFPEIYDPQPVAPAILAFNADGSDVVVRLHEAGNPSGVDWNNPILNGFELVKVPSGILPGDINQDGTVDIVDLGIMAAQWQGAPGSPSADIAPSPIADGFVNLLDFAALAQNWLD